MHMLVKRYMHTLYSNLAKRYIMDRQTLVISYMYTVQVQYSTDEINVRVQHSFAELLVYCTVVRGWIPRCRSRFMSEIMANRGFIILAVITALLIHPRQGSTSGTVVSSAQPVLILCLLYSVQQCPTVRSASLHIIYCTVYSNAQRSASLNIISTVQCTAMSNAQPVLILSLMYSVQQCPTLSQS